MIKIYPLSEEKKLSKRIEEIKDIFYEATSVKNFKDEEHKKTFFEKWCGDYIQNNPTEFYLMVETDNDQLLGYLSGEANSLKALEIMRVPGQKVFEDQFEQFPAHLHINFHVSTRGRGLGSDLVRFYCSVLKSKNISGLHLVTSPEAKNVTFYQKLGFDYQLVREYSGSSLLFMGKIIA